MTAPPAYDVASAGYLTFRFRLPEALSSGPGREKICWRVLDAEGVFRFEITQTPAAAGLLWFWEGPEHKAQDLRILLPSLSGGWHHWAAVWNASRGIFDCTLDAVPLREADIALPPWEHTGKGTDVLVCDSPVEVEDFRHGPEAGDLAALCRDVPEHAREASAKMLGAADMGRFEPSPHLGELIYSNALDQLPCPEDWVAEGPAHFEVCEGSVRVHSLAPADQDEGHVVFWLRRDLPSDFLAEWEACFESDHGLAIAFFAARGVDGADLFSPNLAARDGTFTQYHSGDINCYHISYYANTPAYPGRLTGNLRKNRGFHLVANGPPGIPAASHAWHHMALEKRGDKIRLGVDGRLKIAWTDNGTSFGPALGRGAFGLRQMVWTIASYRNLRITSLTQ